MTTTRASILCALMVALAPISLALYTPALPELVYDFQTTTAAMQLTLTFYFIGFAVAQLICGPLSDAYGRRSVTLGFTAIYLVGSIMAVMSPSVEWLLFARVIQGIGGAVGNAVSRAIVRDLYTGQQSAKIMTTIGIILAVGPALSPFIGGLTLEFFSWQAIFMLMLIFGVVVLVVNYFALPETNRHIDPANFRPKRLFDNYWMLLRDLRFMRQGLILGLSLGCIYVLATVLPFVLIDRVGFTPAEFGLAMMIQSGSFIGGSFIVSWLYRKLDAHAMVPIGIVTIALSGVLFATLTPIFGPNLWTVMVPVGMVSFSNAFIMPSSMTAAVAPFPKIAGSASALVGVFHVGGGLIGSAVIAQFPDPLTGLAVMLPIMIVGVVLVYYPLGAYERRRYPLHVEAAVQVPPTLAAEAVVIVEPAPEVSAVEPARRQAV